MLIHTQRRDVWKACSNVGGMLSICESITDIRVKDIIIGNHDRITHLSLKRYCYESPETYLAWNQERIALGNDAML